MLEVCPEVWSNELKTGLRTCSEDMFSWSEIHTSARSVVFAANIISGEGHRSA